MSAGTLTRDRADRVTLESLADTAPTPMVAMGPDGRIEYWNRAAEELFGWRVEEVRGHSCPMVGDDPADAEAYQRQLARVLEGERPDPVDVWRRTRDNRYIPLRVHMSPRRQPSGEIDGIALVVEPLAEWRELRKRLEHERERFAFLARMSSDWLWETDLEQRFTYVSKHSATDTFPEPLESFIGRTRRELLANAGMDPEPVAGTVDQAMRKGVAFEDLEYAYEHPRRGRVHIRFSGNPVRDEEGQLVGYRGIGADVTETRQREAREAENNALLSQATELAGLGYWTWDLAEQRCIHCSRETARQFGITRQVACDADLCHRIGQSLIHPDDRSGRDATIQQAIDRADCYRTEYRINRASDGAERIIEEFGEAIAGPDGQVERVVGSTQDVTVARAEASQAREGERQYRMLANISAQLHMITTVGDDGRPNDVWVAGSLPGIREINAPRQESDCVLNRNVHPEDEHVLRARRARFYRGLASTDEVRLRTANGDVRHVRAYGHAETDAAGRVVRIYEACEDITDQRHLEREIEQRDARIRRVAENLPGAMFQEIVHPNGARHHAFIFGGLRHRLGLAEEAPPERWLEQMVDDDREAIAQDTVDALARGHAVARDARFLSATGETLWVRLSKTPRGIRNADGSVTFDGVLLDITAQRAAEERQKTADKMQSLGTLAGGVAHDFNNMLQSILMFAEHLEKRADAPRDREAIEMILDSAREGRNLVQQILDFARHDQNADPKAIEPGPIVRDALRMMRTSLPPTVHVDLDIATTDRLSANPTQLSQIVFNLVRNAAQAAAPSGSVSVSLAAISSASPIAAVHRDLPPGRYLVLRVEDDGPGIPPGDQTRIFDPFFSTKSMTDASGLGLSVTLGHVERHAGGIRLQTASGRGTRFDVYLPALDQMEAGTVREIPDMRLSNPQETSGTQD